MPTPKRPCCRSPCATRHAGSGHFLVAAGRRIAARLAVVRAEGAEPTVEEAHQAIHDVVAHCLYGVDVNPLAAELAKVSLWLEGLQAGRPLSLLDGHIKIGNALLGTTPALLAEGLPDEAFAPIEGDDRKTAASLKKRNKAERSGQGRFGHTGTITVGTSALAAQTAAIEALVPRDLADVHVAARRLRDLAVSPDALRARHVADAWCAAFVLPKLPDAAELTHATLEAIQAGSASPAVVEAVKRVGDRYRWFHWHLEYPHIFTTGGTDADPGTGWGGGFDCVVGNPPWERVKLQEQEWFASRLPIIAEATTAAARKQLIAALANDHPELYANFLADRRQAEGDSHFIRNSGRFPLAGRGDINTYAVFAETDRTLLGPEARLGVILPTGIATDATTQYFFKDLVTSKALVSLYGFYDRGKLFEGADVHSFCLLTVAGQQDRQDAAEFAFYASHPDDLKREGTRFTLTPDEITLLNPNTGTCPVFRTRRDAEITLAVYRRHPVLIRRGDLDGNPWDLAFMTMFHMSNDSGLFHTRDQLERDGWTLDGNIFCRGDETMLPLYEAKMIHQYDHRWATYDDGCNIRAVTDDEHADPDFVVLPRYWLRSGEVDDQLVGRWAHDWLLGFRDICRSTDERTLISALLPVTAIGNKLPLLLPAVARPWCLAAALSSVPFDYAVRQKLGGTTMNFFYVEQNPVPRPSVFAGPFHSLQSETFAQWIETRMLELLYTSWDVVLVARTRGDDGPPFVWAPKRRATIRSELDALFFHIYGINRQDAEYILSTFPISNRRDPDLAARILAAYDGVAAAIEIGEPFVSALDPPPGHGPRHPARSM